MIEFQKLRWQNFRSFGNHWTEIDLNSKVNTLITGENGSGKSTFLEALSFALYGKPYSNITKPELINEILNKNCLVELEFKIGQHDYFIRRGLKPAVFEILKDGELVRQDAMARDYQIYLEENILKMDYKSFCQIDVLGAADFKPFMQLPAAGRRTIIEDLLDLQIFTDMNAKLKERVQTNKYDISSYESIISVKKQLIELNDKHIEQQANDIEAEAKSIQDKIDDTDGEIKTLSKEIAGIDKKVKAEKAKLVKFDQIAANITKINLGIEKLEKIRVKHQKVVQFYEMNCVCATCQQNIDESFKAEQIKNANNSIKDIDDKIKSADNKRNKLRKEYEGVNEVKTAINELNVKWSDLNLDINAKQALRDSYEKNLKKLTTKREEIDTTLRQQYINEMAETRVLLDEAMEQREVLTIASQLLKDGGIKSLIIKQYVPIMNRTINQYLKAMNLYVDFRLDENFDAQIKSRGCDNRSYNSFSQGEKARIDLAILFSWRAIARMRNSSSTNLLVFDEIFDGPLDATGIDDFMNILNTLLEKDTNVFMITHKVDMVIDSFENILNVSKKQNFSKMEKVV